MDANILSNVIPGCFQYDPEEKKFLIERVRRRPQSLLEEGKAAAEAIFQQSQGTIHLMISGGADSEFMFRSFERAQIAFKPVCIRFFERGQLINDYDYYFAKQLCLKSGLELHKIDKDVTDFLSDELEVLIGAFTTILASLPIYFHSIRELKGTVIIACGDVFGDLALRRRAYSDDFYFSEASHWSRIISKLRTSAGPLVVPRFLLSTPELLGSFICCEETRKFLRLAKAMRLLRFNRLKPLVYFRHAQIEPRFKRHGLEEWSRFPQRSAELRERYTKADYRAEIDFKEIIFQLGIEREFI